MLLSSIPIQAEAAVGGNIVHAVIRPAMRANRALQHVATVFVTAYWARGKAQVQPTLYIDSHAS